MLIISIITIIIIVIIIFVSIIIFGLMLVIMVVCVFASSLAFTCTCPWHTPCHRFDIITIIVALFFGIIFFLVTIGVILAVTLSLTLWTFTSSSASCRHLHHHPHCSYNWRVAFFYHVHRRIILGRMILWVLFIVHFCCIIASSTASVSYHLYYDHPCRH